MCLRATHLRGELASDGITVDLGLSPPAVLYGDAPVTLAATADALHVARHIAVPLTPVLAASLAVGVAYRSPDRDLWLVPTPESRSMQWVQARTLRAALASRVTSEHVAHEIGRFAPEASAHPLAAEVRAMLAKSRGDAAGFRVASGVIRTAEEPRAHMLLWSGGELHRMCLRHARSDDDRRSEGVVALRLPQAHDARAAWLVEFLPAGVAVVPSPAVAAVDASAQ